MGLPPFVSAAWLEANLGTVVVADLRWFLDGRDAHAAYLEGHLPGAVFVDLDADLAGAPSVAGGRHPLPSPEAFAAAMSRHGIGDGDRVVAYDQGPGAIAARLVWMLRVTGHDAAVLDGGIAAWPGPLEAGPSAASVRGDFTAVPWPEDRFVDADGVAEAVGRGVVVIDARAAERYRDDIEPVDARAGHVPGAVNLPFDGNLRDGLLLPVTSLRERFAAAAGDGDEPIVYCGSGVTACHDVLAMEAAGIRARLFPGSWSAWSADPARPVASGDQP